MLKVKNWNRFQHYKNRKPGSKLTWIKFYTDLLNDLEWFKLDDQSKATLVMLWLVASEYDGNLPPENQLAFRLRTSEKQLKATILKLSHWIQFDSSGALDGLYSPSRQEKEEEKEEEKIKTLVPCGTPAHEFGKSISINPKEIEFKELEGLIPTCKEVEIAETILDGEPVMTVEDVIELWNSKASPELPRVKLVAKTREVHVKARLKSFPHRHQWEHLIERVNSSPFLIGLKTTWRCDFDWVINPTNMAKILEGNYDDTGNRSNNNSSRFATR